MNVYEKLNESRLRFAKANVKKSGKNDYAKYQYFELSDIIPEILKICQELKATYTIKFDENLCFLEFIDCEKPEDRILFSSPMSTASLKGCHDVQNLGAVETYLTRYLLQTCFAIVENDVLDATTKKIDILIDEVRKALDSGIWNSNQIEYAKKCINNQDVKELERIVASLH